VLRQPALARTLQRLDAGGFQDFYRGGIARDIVADMERSGGFVRTDDLDGALDVSETEPLWGSFDGSRVASVGPPGGGLALIQMLQMASSRPGDELDLDRPAGVARVAALISRARGDRTRRRLLTGVDEVGSAADLLDPDYATRAAEECLAATLADPPETSPADRQGDGETSHVSVMDGEGNVVSLTQSIERCFGAAVMTPGLGFLYNGYLRTFKVRKRRHPHYLRPDAPARSNAAPTIIFRDEAVRATLGSTGSERTASGILEVLLRLRRDRPFDAVHGPRLHSTAERRVLWEEERFPEGSREALLERGFAPETAGPYSFKLGGLQLVTRDRETLTGVAEPRRDGAAAGPAG
jgi:gamma-glutamyltranspeptidase/glutathione hydrolase